MIVNISAMHYDVSEGYGLTAVKFIEHINLAGDPNFSTVPLSREQLGWPTRLLKFSQIDITNPLLHFGQPTDHDFSAIPGRAWLFTMYETDKIPDTWPDLINSRFERVIVPCQHNAEVFKRCGITVPIHVVPLGVEPPPLPSTYPPVRHSEPFVFLALADRLVRKGYDIAMQAFTRAFGDDENVRLIIKSKVDQHGSELPGMFRAADLDPRISFWRYNADDMSSVYEIADCFVFPSRGEGFGLPPREATVLGIPSIVTPWAGMADADKWAIPITDFTLMRSFAMRGGGLWAEPAVDGVAEKMRWVYDNRNEANEIAARGAEYLTSNFTWSQAAQKLLTLFNKYMRV